MDHFARDHGAELGFSQPGTPADKAKVESFNGRFRAGALSRSGHSWTVDCTGAKCSEERADWTTTADRDCAQHAT